MRYGRKFEAVSRKRRPRHISWRRNGPIVRSSGHTGNIESNRYPMYWKDDMTKREVYQLYHQLALLKRSSEALQAGGFKVVSDNDFVICYVRFIPKKQFL